MNAVQNNQGYKIESKDLRVYFPIKKGPLRLTRGYIRAVDGVDFYINSGETLGLVGESGCGKTTTGRAILRLVQATDGQVQFLTRNGETVDVLSLARDELREVRPDMQLIFQDPYYSLNPRMRVGQLVSEPLLVNKIGTRESRKDRVAELLELVGLDAYCIDRYPHEFSGGQRQRIGIARALALNPSFIVCDEPVSALDLSVQAQVLNLLKDIQQQLDLTLLFIAHDLSVVYHISDRVAVMYLGKIVETTDSESIYKRPMHPYTEALISALPVPDPDVKPDYILLPGTVPDPSNPPSGCHFHTRCRYAQDICSREIPLLMPLKDDASHAVACHRAEELDLRSISIEESKEKL